MRPLIVANWKMNKKLAEAQGFGERLIALLGHHSPSGGGPEVAIAPPYTALSALAALLVDSPIALAAQDVSVHASGAFTGEIAADMLCDVGCQYGLVGHSERRKGWSESSHEVSQKAEALLQAGLTPIVCVGETLEEREAGRTEDVVLEQLGASLPPAGTPDRDSLVVAYEPVWAIGTGLTATPDQAQEVHALIRGCLVEEFGRAAAEIRIQYGGSVNSDNVKSLMAQQDIDGALVGGASLEADDFAKIVQYDR